MNPSKKQGYRFYRRWDRSGALGDMNGPYPSSKKIMEELSDMNFKHMVQTSEIYYILQWMPKEILEAEGMSFENPYDIRPYVALTLFEKITENQEHWEKLPSGMLYSIGKLLDEVDKDGFRTADDYPLPEAA